MVSKPINCSFNSLNFRAGCYTTTAKNTAKTVKQTNSSWERCSGGSGYHTQPTAVTHSTVYGEHGLCSKLTADKAGFPSTT